jgi:hypothetical protein
MLYFSTRRSPSMALLVVLFTTACGGARTQQQDSSLAPALGRVTLITSEMIGPMGAETAWDVIQRRAPQAVRTMRMPSVVNRESVEPPLVIIDGTPVMDLRSLVLIRAADVHIIRILGTIDGGSLYGPRASGGAIEVLTKRS